MNGPDPSVACSTFTAPHRTTVVICQDEEARDLLFLAACGKLDLRLSGSTVTDVFYLVNRHVTHDKARSLEIVDTLMQSLPVVDAGMRECLFAAHSPIQDFEVAVVAEAALSAKLDYIITRNLSGYERSEVPAISPHDYLALHISGYAG